MIPRRIEADRAKGADTEAAPFSSIVSMESFSHRASRPPFSISLSLSLALTLFSRSPSCRCTRVHGETIKKTRSQKVRGAPPLMNAATSWPPCFPSAGVCTPYSPKHPLCRVPPCADFPTPRKTAIEPLYIQRVYCVLRRPEVILRALCETRNG